MQVARVRRVVLDGLGLTSCVARAWPICSHHCSRSSGWDPGFCLLTPEAASDPASNRRRQRRGSRDRAPTGHPATQDHLGRWPARGERRQLAGVSPARPPRFAGAVLLAGRRL